MNDTLHYFPVWGVLCHRDGTGDFGNPQFHVVHGGWQFEYNEALGYRTFWAPVIGDHSQLLPSTRVEYTRKQFDEAYPNFGY